ncbi:maltose alpha-D-glucosyltransferase [Pseudomonas syringae group genomosp. 3]|uniref:Glycosidase, putative n=1 Tax=Pseudomonas syringae pv. tomato (strain ATCC BAA-871 / DC3000) TaxID=223283 RepID=Q881E2_PSESM|nr:maltose alpha-D-glucosyltransferase [Pseudomonas syringae group genomosp. 3]AAO56444.1 glycosidase, putative [Pseudomonas syringae pv. tomato str. DC3000]KKI26124.1 trehalose synthase [Pseudomonas syringae pv. persicae]KPB88972.1 Glycosidase [Pseudomonas syringae pv. maculicola]KPY97272.1 putative Glycosidase [Pseudomonas syringae pv. tomato]MBF9245849.1 maltose alpha-D-glucosyltransferase [Pseudomonas syringae pv. tomato]
MTIPDKQYVDWLVEQSMLNAARQRAKTYSGQGRLWQRPFALARPRDASAIASVWFTAYPASIVTREGGSVLEALGDETLWHALSEIGIQGIHNGPLKLSGGLKGRERTPSIDGNFDRISFGIDPDLGTEAQLLSLSRIAAAHNAVIIDDIIPSHTGKGADFRLAEMAYEDYPGLFHMVEIREEDWPLLPEVAAGRDAVNLMPEVVDQLRDKHYIVGQLQRVIFFEPGVKETDWSATDVVQGVDGKARRWVYLHYFKDGQPSLNWLDPSFAAQQMIIGDALHAIDVMGARVLRLDANGFLGVERRAEGTAWSESHPLSITGNQLLAGAIRKAGGFSFQELNLTIDDIASMGQGGADLSYDFITRPAYQHALLTGTTEFLRLMLRQVHAYGIDPASLIHALQNHDELTLELVHFWTLHAHDTFHYQGQTFPGNILREHIREEMYEKLSGEHAPYNLKFVTNGVSCTTASIITAALGIRDLSTITDADTQQIQHIHLLLVMYNAMQPGVFALSGWDLVGALTLPAEQVEHLMQDGDTRWVHRGAYDLVDLDPEAEFSAGDMPRPKTLYGSLVSQLQRPDSFASQLKKILAVRRAYDIAASRQILIPDVEHPGLLVMVHELPAGKGTQITALNFSAETLVETLHLPGIAPGPVVDIINERVEGDLTEQGEFTITLDAYEGLALRVVSTLPI